MNADEWKKEARDIGIAVAQIAAPVTVSLAESARVDAGKAEDAP
jgi:hypothetical protein